MHVVLAGGGTAGHVEPALAVADALRQLLPGIRITALGTERGLETRLVPARGYPLELIPAVPLPRRVTGDLVTVPSRLSRAVSATARVLATTEADALVGFGGYVALPGYLAARRSGVPIVVHEANARPGLANRIGARFAAAVAVGTPTSPLPRAQYVGIPLRPVIAALDRAASRVEAARVFGLDPDLPTLLVTGGSQGARRINESVTAAAATLAAAGVQVLHVTGPANAEDVGAALGGRPPAGPAYVVLPYVDRMDLAYAAADLALCRAGALTCAEMAAVGLPAVYVPLAIGNGEQRLNAVPVVSAGGGLLVDNAALDADRIRAILVPLLRDPPRLTAMGAAAGRLGRRDADVAVARLVLAAAGARAAA